jgi:signal peptidase I
MFKSLLVVVAAVALVQLTQAQSPAGYARGETVRLVAQENGSPLPDSRVVAIVGDRVHIDNSSFTVNGVVVQGVSPELLKTIANAWDQLVPQGHYFVIGESGTRDDMVRYYGLIPAEKIIGKV